MTESSLWATKASAPSPCVHLVQISTSARATLGNTCFSQACLRIGAVWYMAGASSSSAAWPRATVWPISGLERISVGGEVVTAALKARCRQLFGDVAFLEGFGMTEVWPLGGTRCAAGNLHFDPLRGLVEVLSLETSGAALPGEPGRLVATPFAPYRDASVVLRYDTEDIVEALAGPCTCRWRDWPATSDIQGKLRLSVRHDHGWTCPRPILEALESIEDVPLPVRCGFWSDTNGVAVEAVVRTATPATRRRIEAALEEQKVPLAALHLVEDPGQLQHPLPLRCDLREDSFLRATPSAVPMNGAPSRLGKERL